MSLMIGWATRLKVVVFVVVSLLGVGYVGFRYVGIGQQLVGGVYVVHADFAVAGGIYRNAPVTFRGVPVGQVGSIALHGNGVRVDLVLHRGVTVPVSLRAVVAQRSAVGEQYVDLRPDTDTGPYLRDGDVIPADRTGTPLAVETLLANLDALVHSVNVQDLTVLIDELGTAFAADGTALRRILDASGSLLQSAVEHLPDTLTLIHDGRTVLSTQAESADAIRRWAAGLAKLTDALRASDPDLRRLLAAGPPAATQLVGLLRDVDPTIGTLLGNLVTVNGIAVRRLPGIEQILVEFPLVVAGGFTVAPGDGTAHFGLVVNFNDPPPCQYGQSGQQGCHAVRGANAAPGPSAGDPSPAPAGGPGPHQTAGPGPQRTAGPGPSGPATVLGFDPVTGLVTGPDGLPLELGGTGGQYQLAGDQSWKQLLLAGLQP
jgi:phospholipid/cholesterol/gamma-HCH transport system substrate-binding protein